MIHDVLRPQYPNIIASACTAFTPLRGCRSGKTKRISVRVSLVAALAVNQTWSLDFVSDAIARLDAVSRRIKCLTVADDFSHECVDISVDFGIGGAYVTRLLDRATTFRGCPKEVRTDNGPEFTCRAFPISIKRPKRSPNSGQQIRYPIPRFRRQSPLIPGNHLSLCIDQQSQWQLGRRRQ